jgi:uncharacterized RDD family membrane protein YckC
VSILPLPDFTPETAQSPLDAAIQPAESIHLFALDAYSGQPGALPGVSFWPRAGARVIDMVVHYCISFCSGLLLGFSLAIVAALQHISVRTMLRGRTLHGITPFVFALLGMVAFEAICEGFHGSTPGKLMLSMVVIQEDGSPCRPGSAWIRSFAYIVDSLFFGLVGYFNMQKNPQQQRHGDEWAHTIVCRRANVAAQSLRGLGRFSLVLFFATLAAAALAILGMVIQLTS